VENEPFLTLHDIAEKADVGLGKTTVDKIIGEAGFKLIIPRKKPYWRKGQKQKRINFASRRLRWTREWGGLFLLMKPLSSTTQILLERRFASAQRGVRRQKPQPNFQIWAN
jgi:hypothetical protein